MRKAVTHLKKSDPVMRAIIERLGPCRMQFGPPEFHSLAEAIVYQQLNGKAAETIFKRFAALAGEPLTPEGILKLSDEQMRGAGLSKQKSAYLKDLAAKTSSGLVDFARLPESAGCRSGRASDPGERYWRMDCADVSDVHIEARECSADRRFRRSHGDVQTLSRSTSGRRQRRSLRRQKRKVASGRSSCPVRSRWRRSQSAGSLIAAWHAGICGRVWIQKHFSHSKRNAASVLAGGRCV